MNVNDMSEEDFAAATFCNCGSEFAWGLALVEDHRLPEVANQLRLQARRNEWSAKPNAVAVRALRDLAELCEHEAQRRRDEGEKPFTCDHDPFDGHHSDGECGR